MTAVKKNKFVPFDIPVPELSQFGSEIKSEKPFRKNLLNIAQIANAENAILIVPFFAFHPSPPDQKMTTIWGEPKNVIKGIQGLYISWFLLFMTSRANTTHLLQQAYNFY